MFHKREERSRNVSSCTQSIVELREDQLNLLNLGAEASASDEPFFQ